MVDLNEDVLYKLFMQAPSFKKKKRKEKQLFLHSLIFSNREAAFSTFPELCFGKSFSGTVDVLFLLASPVSLVSLHLGCLAHIIVGDKTIKKYRQIASPCNLVLSHCCQECALQSRMKDTPELNGEKVSLKANN